MCKNSHNYFEKEQREELVLPDVVILQSYMNLNNVALAQIQSKKTMKWNRIQK